MSIQDMVDKSFAEWQKAEATAEAMIPLIGQLYRKHNVVLSVYGRPLINRSVIDIIKAHRFVRHIESREISVQDTFPILQILIERAPVSCHLDIGKMAMRFLNQSGQQHLGLFVQNELARLDTTSHEARADAQDVVLYGFGRIGRLLARIMIRKAGNGKRLRLRAIVVRKAGADDLEKRASLLRRDSVHGTFSGSIKVDRQNNALIANGHYIQVIYANGPEEVDYTEYGISDAIVVDNTGKWRDREGLGLHAACPGVSRVLLTAPGKGDIPNIVHGINHRDIRNDENILSAASCTTNAITPVLKVINDRFGIEYGHVETVHSYTNDQNLIDNYHKGSRRGRSAPLNMVITETGAASAVAKALPELSGKLTGNAIRVPTPNVSMAILNLTLREETSRNVINEFLRDVALNSALKKQIDYVNSAEIVSSDVVGSRHAGVVDSEATIVSGRHCVLYVWYDNEYGYSCQVVRVLEYISGMDAPALD
jgi:glyceraldehyde 3-phosphate dehydrogenase